MRGRNKALVQKEQEPYLALRNVNFETVAAVLLAAEVAGVTPGLGGHPTHSCLAHWNPRRS